MYASVEKESQPEIVKPGLQRRITHLENIMTVVIDFSNIMGEPDPPHAHPHEQITYVAEGELWFFVGEEKYLLVKGDMVKIPSGMPHTVQTLTPNVRLIDSFAPVREDFLK